MPEAQVTASRRRRPIRYLRSPWVIPQWHADSLSIHNLQSRRAFGLADAAWPLLTFCGVPRTLAAIEKAFPQFSRASVHSTIAALAETEILIEAPTRSPLGPWAALGQPATILHYSTKDTRYMTAREIGRSLRARLRRKDSPPPPTKRLTGVTVALPQPRLDPSLFWDVLRQRRTWRRFGRGPLSITDLASLLQLTFGVKQWLNVGPLGRAALKTSPSGGGCHPIEAYVCAQRVEGLPPGIYHYAWDRHALVRIDARMSVREMASYIPNQPWFHRAPVVVFMTAMLERVVWHYPNSRAYRAVLLEAGHFCQTLCLTATALGLAPFQTLALADSKVESALKLDRVREPLLYAAGIGRRPSDGRDPAFAPGLQKYAL